MNTFCGSAPFVSIGISFFVKPTAFNPFGNVTSFINCIMRSRRIGPISAVVADFVLAPNNSAASK